MHDSSSDEIHIKVLNQLKS